MALVLPLQHQYLNEGNVMTTYNEYRYQAFTTNILLRDMRFHKSAPKAGEK